MCTKWIFILTTVTLSQTIYQLVKYKVWSNPGINLIKFNYNFFIKLTPQLVIAASSDGNSDFHRSSMQIYLYISMNTLLVICVVSESALH